MPKENKTLIKTLNAFLKLLEKKDFDSISVTEIVNECGFSRQNFYKNFASKQVFIREIFLYDFKRGIEEEYVFRFRYSSKIIMSCLEEHKSFYKAVLKSENDEFLFRLIREYSFVILNSFVEYSAFKANEEQIRAIEFFVNGLTATVLMWLSEKTTYSPDDVSVILSANIPPCLSFFIIEEEEITSDYLLYKIRKRGDVW